MYEYKAKIVKWLMAIQLTLWLILVSRFKPFNVYDWRVLIRQSAASLPIQRLKSLVNKKMNKNFLDSFE